MSTTTNAADTARQELGASFGGELVGPATPATTRRARSTTR